MVFQRGQVAADRYEARFRRLQQASMSLCPPQVLLVYGTPQPVLLTFVSYKPQHLVHCRFVNLPALPLNHWVLELIRAWRTLHLPYNTLRISSTFWGLPEPLRAEPRR